MIGALSFAMFFFSLAWQRIKYLMKAKAHLLIDMEVIVFKMSIRNSVHFRIILISENYCQLFTVFYLVLLIS